MLIILTPQIIYTKMDSDLVKQIESSRMSWILSDVINLHGEAGLRSRCDEWYDGEMESIYPNFVPEEGFLPLSKGQLSPTGEPMLNSPSCPPGSEPASPSMPPAQGSEPTPDATAVARSESAGQWSLWRRRVGRRGEAGAIFGAAARDALGEWQVVKPNT